MLMVRTRSGRMAQPRSLVARSRQAVAPLLLFAFVVLFPRQAHAETSFTVTYRAPEACPDRDVFIRSVQRRSRIVKPVGPGQQPDVVFDVDLRVRGKKK